MIRIYTVFSLLNKIPLTDQQWLEKDSTGFRGTVERCPHWGGKGCLKESGHSGKIPDRVGIRRSQCSPGGDKKIQMHILPSYPCTAVFLSSAVPVLFPALYPDCPVQLLWETEDSGTDQRRFWYRSIDTMNGKSFL